MNRVAKWANALAMALMAAGCNTDPASPAPRGWVEPARLLVPSGRQFIQVAAGVFHTCALRSDYIIECWGDNSVGQAPLSKASSSGGNYTQVSVGQAHSCAVENPSGNVECWGANGDGRAPAVWTSEIAAFVQVSVGDHHTCALNAAGRIECLGYNDRGQAPAEHDPATAGFTHVGSGRIHTCAIRVDGRAECWGWYVGIGDPALPLVIPRSGNFTKVTAGDMHACALRDDGVVECWGNNIFGEAPAIRNAGSGTFLQIDGGRLHTCAVRSDGVVECWGWNVYGQAPPTKVAATGHFLQVSAGDTHTCAVRDDGIVECWGGNDWGQAPAVRASMNRVLPVATFTATPASVTLGSSFTLGLVGATVPGAAGAVTFTFAFDCGDGTSYGPFGSSNSASCTPASTGTRTVRGTVRDHEGDEREYTSSVSVTPATPAFGGFVAPVDNPPIVNWAKAGGAVPVKFSLGGDYGLAIFAAGFPASQPIQCDVSAPGDPIVETVTAGASVLSYSATTSLYTYVWKNEKSWANTCRKLILRLLDGREYFALFQFPR